MGRMTRSPRSSMTSSNPPRSVRLTFVGGDLSTVSAFRRLEDCDSPLCCRFLVEVDVDAGAVSAPLDSVVAVVVCGFDPVFHMPTMLLLRLLDS